MVPEEEGRAMHSDTSDWRKDEENLRRQMSILAAAIQVEKYGYEFYTAMSKCIKDKNGKIILKSLAEDESQHRAWLERQIDRISPGKNPATITPDQSYIRLIPSKIFPSTTGETCLVLEDEIKGLEIGVQIEKNSVRMYSEAADLSSDPETRVVMLRLANWEKGHQKILEENLQYLRRGGSWYGYTPILDG
jgi:rubrerythrin